MHRVQQKVGGSATLSRHSAAAVAHAQGLVAPKLGSTASTNWTTWAATLAWVATSGCAPHLRRQRGKQGVRRQCRLWGLSSTQHPASPCGAPVAGVKGLAGELQEVGVASQAGGLEARVGCRHVLLIGHVLPGPSGYMEDWQAYVRRRACMQQRPQGCRRWQVRAAGAGSRCQQGGGMPQLHPHASLHACRPAPAWAA